MRKSRLAPFTMDWLLQWVIPEPNSGCWLWVGQLNAGGYGSVGFHGKTRNAHRVSYFLATGDEVLGFDLDHLCRVRSCVNPAHLEPVSRSENLRRGNTGDNLATRAAAVTHCPRGHAYLGSNLYTCPRGHRNCVACQRQRVRIWRSAKNNFANGERA